jgi:hypothetical protein
MVQKPYSHKNPLRHAKGDPARDPLINRIKNQQTAALTLGGCLPNRTGRPAIRVGHEGEGPCNRRRVRRLVCEHAGGVRTRAKLHRVPARRASPGYQHAARRDADDLEAMQPVADLHACATVPCSSNRRRASRCIAASVSAALKIGGVAGWCRKSSNWYGAMVT